MEGYPQGFDFQGMAALVAVLGTLPIGFYTMYRQIRADRKADKTQEGLDLVAHNQQKTHDDLRTVVDTVAGVQQNVAKVELATNSMKDALVHTTALANLLQGRSEGVAAEKARARADVDSAQPDGAPTSEEIASAHQEQVKAVAIDAAMRVTEKQTIGKP